MTRPGNSSVAERRAPARVVRVVLADDHTLVREALSTHLSDAPDVEVVGVAPDAESALTIAAHERPDVVVFDIDMPGRLVFDVATRLRSLLPRTRVLFLSAFRHDQYIRRALESGALGYLTKGDSMDHLVAAVRRVAAGKMVFSPEIEARLTLDINGPTLRADRATRLGLLTPREIEVLTYISRGMSKKEVAATVHLSVKTVENHCTSLMSKLDIHDRVELTRFAIREGLTEA